MRLFVAVLLLCLAYSSVATSLPPNFIGTWNSNGCTDTSSDNQVSSVMTTFTSCDGVNFEIYKRQYKNSRTCSAPTLYLSSRISGSYSSVVSQTSISNVAISISQFALTCHTDMCRNELVGLCNAPELVSMQLGMPTALQSSCISSYGQQLGFANSQECPVRYASMSFANGVLRMGDPIDLSRRLSSCSADTAAAWNGPSSLFFNNKGPCGHPMQGRWMEASACSPFTENNIKKSRQHSLSVCDGSTFVDSQLDFLGDGCVPANLYSSFTVKGSLDLTQPALSQRNMPIAKATYEAFNVTCYSTACIEEFTKMTPLAASLQVGVPLNVLLTGVTVNPGGLPMDSPNAGIRSLLECPTRFLEYSLSQDQLSIVFVPEIQDRDLGCSVSRPMPFHQEQRFSSRSLCSAGVTAGVYASKSCQDSKHFSVQVGCPVPPNPWGVTASPDLMVVRQREYNNADCNSDSSSSIQFEYTFVSRFSAVSPSSSVIMLNPLMSQMRTQNPQQIAQMCNVAVPDGGTFDLLQMSCLPGSVDGFGNAPASECPTRFVTVGFNPNQPSQALPYNFESRLASCAQSSPMALNFAGMRAICEDGAGYNSDFPLNGITSVPCPEGCNNCTSSACYGCYPGYVPISQMGQQQVQCMPIYNGTCPEPDCLLCGFNNGAFCLECKNGTAPHFRNDLQRHVCTAPYFGPCSDRCGYCFGPSSAECQACYPGYMLTSAGCVMGPVANCSSYNSDAQCERCLDGFQLVNGQCVKVVCDSGCFCPSGSQNSCPMCQPGYAQFFNSTSLKQQCVRMTCEDPKCILCPNSPSSCQACDDRYDLKPVVADNTMSLRCLPANCQDPTCLHCPFNTSFCIACSPGSYGVNGQCLAPCQGSTTDFCALCQGQAPNVCAMCQSGYRLLNGQCVSVQCQDPMCTHCSDDGSCASCSSGLMPFGPYCVRGSGCPAGCQLCRTGSSGNTICQLCNSGYSLSGDGACVESTPPGQCSSPCNWPAMLQRISVALQQNGQIN